MGLLGSLLKTAIHTVTTPIEITKDIATLGGVLTGEEESYTAKRIEKIQRDLIETEREIDKL